MANYKQITWQKQNKKSPSISIKCGKENTNEPIEVANRFFFEYSRKHKKEIGNQTFYKFSYVTYKWPKKFFISYADRHC